VADIEGLAAAVERCLAWFDEPSVRDMSAAALRALPWASVERAQHALVERQVDRLCALLDGACEARVMDGLQTELARAREWLIEEEERAASYLVEKLRGAIADGAAVLAEIIALQKATARLEEVLSLDDDDIETTSWQRRSRKRSSTR